MQPNFDALDRVTYLIGSDDILEQLTLNSANKPFSEEIIELLNEVSKEIIRYPQSKEYSDVVTFGFWIRKGHTLKLKERFHKNEILQLGKGVVFHIAPSNVPVNFAYSLVCGLLCGNSNIVRLPQKSFPQVDIIINAFNKVLEEYPKFKTYIICVKYERDKKINDFFSSISDMRIIWGGNQTIEEIRKSPLPPRSGEITFADRYSMAVIDADAYLKIPDKDRVAKDFYNDTFFSDQNACTSPRIIIWVGKNIEEAKRIFWEIEHKLVKETYRFQAIQCVNKLTQSYLAAVALPDVKVEEHSDNLIIRIAVSQITDDLMDYCDNSGYFYEYNCDDIIMLKDLCNNKRCQTIAYIGDNNILNPLLDMGIKGVDRIVPMGRTMDFDLIWDGYELSSILTRSIIIS